MREVERGREAIVKHVHLFNVNKTADSSLLLASNLSTQCCLECRTSRTSGSSITL